MVERQMILAIGQSQDFEITCIPPECAGWCEKQPLPTPGFLGARWDHVGGGSDSGQRFRERKRDKMTRPRG